MRGVSVGTLIYVLEAMGYGRNFMRGIRPVSGGERVVGRARTLRTLPYRQDVYLEQKEAGLGFNPHRRAFDECGADEVLVIEARGDMRAGVMGDLLARRLIARGASGVVTDGCVRDVPELRSLALPVFARGINASTFRMQHVGIEVDVPIACGGVLVRSGDLVVGDSEGVAVLPEAVADAVVEAAKEQDVLDAFVTEKIAEGEALHRCFPPVADLKREFEERKSLARQERLVQEDGSKRSVD